MKHLFVFLFALSFSAFLYAQDPTPAAKGVTYGAGTTAEGAIAVVEVCQDKGCWMKVEQANGENLMVKFKDYKYFMPKNIVGKEVVLDGEAIVKEVSVKQLQHYAKDAGKSDEEIKKIKEPKKEVQFVAKGVLVL
jgi:Domain of unknown function (DUF4920)